MASDLGRLRCIQDGGAKVAKYKPDIWDGELGKVRGRGDSRVGAPPLDVMDPSWSLHGQTTAPAVA